MCDLSDIICVIAFNVLILFVTSGITVVGVIIVVLVTIIIVIICLIVKRKKLWVTLNQGMCVISKYINSNTVFHG